MAKGEMSWNAGSVQVKKFNFDPLPNGEYDMKLDGRTLEIRKKQEPGSFPRVASRFTAVGTGKDGQKDRIVFHDFYVRTEPNEKGTVLVAMSGQLVDFIKALGLDPDDVDLPLIDVNGEKCIDAVALKKWLENRDGEVVKARVRTEKDQNGEPRNRIGAFIEAEGAAGASDEDEDEGDDDEPAFAKKGKNGKKR